MAKKEATAAEQAQVQSTDPLYEMVKLVGEEKLSLKEATKILRQYIAVELTTEQQEEWKKNAVPRARRLMSIAEAFSQELTVIAAGQ